MGYAYLHKGRIRLPIDYGVYEFDPQAKPVGEGAMGTVYRGQSLTDGSEVAVKRVNPRYAAIPSVRRRAREEAAMLFRHPHLIEMVGVCEAPPGDDPEMFVVSNFVRGVTLDVHVDRHLRQLPNRVGKICECILPVLDALAYIHSHGIVHLDIKPSNIMVETGHTNIRLMDFGIAYRREGAEITSAGLLGTPAYAAPEQYVTPGKTPAIDRRTDLYQLGVTLYELLGGSKTGTDPRHRSLSRLAGVNRSLMQVVEKATHPEMSERYSTAAEMKADLKNAMNGRPESLRNALQAAAIVGTAIAAAALAVWWLGL